MEKKILAVSKKMICVCFSLGKNEKLVDTL